MGVDPALLAVFVRGLGIPHKENKVSYIFACPKCRKKDKFYVRKRDGRFVCWFCKETEGFEGRGDFGLAELAGLPLSDVRSALGLGAAEATTGVDLGGGLIDWFDGPPPEPEAEPLRPLEWPFDYYPLDHPHGANGAKYLEERGVPLATAVRYGLRYCPTRRRVVFPIEQDGNLYGWQARLAGPNRWWDDEQAEWKETVKVLSSKEVPRDQLLMFADRLRGSEHAVLCEGPLDAIKADLCGGNVCAMGKAVSKRQMGLLRCAGIRRIYLALDPDAGDETARLAKEFSDLDVRWMDPYPAKDLGELSPEAVLELFRSAPPVGSATLFLRCL